MPRPTNKRKMSKEGSGDETLPAVQKKTRSKSKNAVKFAETSTDAAREPVQTRSSKTRLPKSILKVKSTPLPATPESPKAAESPFSRASEQPKEEEVDTEDGDTMITLAATAMKLAEDARTERLQTGLVASYKDLAATRTDRENENIYKEVLLETSDLMDTRKRAETAIAQLKEALLANDRSENRIMTLETQVKKSEEQVENLQRELAAIKEEKAKMEKLLGERTAMETPEAVKGVAK